MIIPGVGQFKIANKANIWNVPYCVLFEGCHWSVDQINVSNDRNHVFVKDVRNKINVCNDPNNALLKDVLD